MGLIDIFSDQIIRLTGTGAKEKCPAHSDLDSPDRHAPAQVAAHLSKAGWSFLNLASMLRLNLFPCRDLIEWLHHPFSTEPIVPRPEQLYLPSSGLGQSRPSKVGTST